MVCGAACLLDYSGAAVRLGEDVQVLPVRVVHCACFLWCSYSENRTGVPNGFDGCGSACQLYRHPRSVAMREGRFGVVGEPGAIYRQFLVGGRGRCRIHLALFALGGFAQHGVGRAPTRSAQEACHRRAAVEQMNLLHVHLRFFGPNDACTPLGGKVLGCAGGRGPALCLWMQRVARIRCEFAVCITVPCFAVPNLDLAQVRSRRGIAAKLRGHFLSSPTWSSRK